MLATHSWLIGGLYPYFDEGGKQFRVPGRWRWNTPLSVDGAQATQEYLRVLSEHFEKFRFGSTTKISIGIVCSHTAGKIAFETDN